MNPNHSVYGPGPGTQSLQSSQSLGTSSRASLAEDPLSPVESAANSIKSTTSGTSSSGRLTSARSTIRSFTHSFLKRSKSSVGRFRSNSGAATGSLEGVNGNGRNSTRMGGGPGHGAGGGIGLGGLNRSMTTNTCRAPVKMELMDSGDEDDSEENGDSMNSTDSMNSADSIKALSLGKSDDLTSKNPATQSFYHSPKLEPQDAPEDLTMTGQSPPAVPLPEFVTATVDYPAQGSSGLRLGLGDVIQVLDVDGTWYEGTNTRGERGWFPIEFTTKTPDQPQTQTQVSSQTPDIKVPSNPQSLQPKPQPHTSHTSREPSESECPLDSTNTKHRNLFELDPIRAALDSDHQYQPNNHTDLPMPSTPHTNYRFVSGEALLSCSQSPKSSKTLNTTSHPFPDSYSLKTQKSEDLESYWNPFANSQAHILYYNPQLKLVTDALPFQHISAQQANEMANKGFSLDAPGPENLEEMKLEANTHLNSNSNGNTNTNTNTNSANANPDAHVNNDTNVNTNTTANNNRPNTDNNTNESDTPNSNQNPLLTSTDPYKELLYKYYKNYSHLRKGRAGSVDSLNSGTSLTSNMLIPFKYLEGIESLRTWSAINTRLDIVISTMIKALSAHDQRGIQHGYDLITALVAHISYMSGIPPGTVPSFVPSNRDISTEYRRMMTAMAKLALSVDITRDKGPAFAEYTRNNARSASVVSAFSFDSTNTASEGYIAERKFSVISELSSESGEADAYTLCTRDVKALAKVTKSYIKYFQSASRLTDGSDSFTSPPPPTGCRSSIRSRQSSIAESYTSPFQPDSSSSSNNNSISNMSSSVNNNSGNLSSLSNSYSLNHNDDIRSIASRASSESGISYSVRQFRAGTWAQINVNPFALSATTSGHIRIPRRQSIVPLESYDSFIPLDHEVIKVLEHQRTLVLNFLREIFGQIDTVIKVGGENENSKQNGETRLTGDQLLLFVSSLNSLLVIISNICNLLDSLDLSLYQPLPSFLPKRSPSRAQNYVNVNANANLNANTSTNPNAPQSASPSTSRADQFDLYTWQQRANNKDVHLTILLYDLLSAKQILHDELMGFLYATGATPFGSTHYVKEFAQHLDEVQVENSFFQQQQQIFLKTREGATFAAEIVGPFRTESEVKAKGFKDNNNNSGPSGATNPSNAKEFRKVQGFEEFERIIKARIMSIGVSVDSVTIAAAVLSKERPGLINDNYISAFESAAQYSAALESRRASIAASPGTPLGQTLSGQSIVLGQNTSGLSVAMAPTNTDHSIASNQSFPSVTRIPSFNSGTQSAQGDMTPLGEFSKEDSELWFLAPEHEDELIYDSENKKSVRGGTLRALVEHLTHYNRRDSAFNVAFLLTFRTMVHPVLLFKMLVERYGIQPPAGLNSEEFDIWTERMQKPVRFRVANTLKKWLEDYWFEDPNNPTIENLLKSMNDFTVELERQNSPGYRQIRNQIEVKLRKDYTSHRRLIQNLPSTPPPEPLLPLDGLINFEIADLDPLELARQLSVREYNIFEQITPFECLTRRQSRSKVRNNTLEGTPHIDMFIHNSNCLTNWVCYMILSYDEPAKRANAITYYTTVAKYCRQYHNYSSMMAIISAISSAPVYRLKKTRDLVSEQTSSDLQSMHKVMNSSRNFGEYRDVLAGVSPPAVPFFGVYLTDLTFLEDANSDFIADAGESVINFSKRMKAADLVRDIMQYQSVPYVFTEVPEIQQLLTEGFENCESVDNQYELSLRLEPREGADDRVNKLLHQTGYV